MNAKHANSTSNSQKSSRPRKSSARSKKNPSPTTTCHEPNLVLDPARELPQHANGKQLQKKRGPGRSKTPNSPSIEKLTAGAPVRPNGMRWSKRHVLAAVRRADGVEWNKIAAELEFSDKYVRQLVVVPGWHELLEWVVTQLWSSRVFGAAYKATLDILEGKESNAELAKVRGEYVDRVLKTRDMYAPDRSERRVIHGAEEDLNVIAQRIAARRTRLLIEQTDTIREELPPDREIPSSDP